MAAKSSALAWMVGLGTVALAGVGIYFYEKSAGSTTATQDKTASPGAGVPTGTAAIAAVMSETNLTPAGAQTKRALELASLGNSSHGSWIGSPEEASVRSAAAAARAGGASPVELAALQAVGA